VNNPLRSAGRSLDAPQPPRPDRSATSPVAEDPLPTLPTCAPPARPYEAPPQARGRTPHSA